MLSELGRRRYRLDGCNETAVYQCNNQGCAADVTQLVGPGIVDLTAGPGPRLPTRRDGTAHRRKAVSGAAIISLDLTLDGRAMIALKAIPERHMNLVQVTLTVLDPDYALKSCALELMVNGQRLAPLPTRARQERGMTALRSDADPELMQELASAQQLALRACGERWSFSRDELLEVHRFVGLWEEELAWIRPEGSGKTGGLLAPSGGWPAWSVEGAPGVANTTGGALDAQAVYVAVGPSILVVEVESLGKGKLGSAVAISGTDAITNCHVLAGARSILLRQQERKWSAEVLRASPITDRCVVRADDASFTPIRGVRTYASLQVGEPLYTVGSPSGLELTLADGVLSGLREVDSRRFVQTTAPISPGSSGGGLFDRWGNLVGVTTMILVGSDRVNQALNFAIPADSFWAL
jgi:hypothetical protein